MRSWRSSDWNRKRLVNSLPLEAITYLTHQTVTELPFSLWEKGWDEGLAILNICIVLREMNSRLANSSLAHVKN
jgi:hypothetical protein